jgi:hypothetical protein
MSKDILNETFQKHLGLLHKRLNENGDINIKENDQSSSEHLKKFSPEDLIFNPEKVVSTNEATISGDRSPYADGSEFDDDQEIKMPAGAPDKNPKELQKRLFKLIVEIPIFKFFLDEKHKVISLEPKEISYNSRNEGSLDQPVTEGPKYSLDQRSRIFKSAVTFILKAFSKDGKELGTVELSFIQSPGILNKILSAPFNFIPFLKSNIKQTIAVQRPTGVFNNARHLDDIGFVLHQVFVNHWGRNSIPMYRKDYFKGTADAQDVVGQAPTMLGGFRQ